MVRPITTARAVADRIGDLARATGCPVETIRYYERVGMLPRPERSPGGHRTYGPGQRARLAFVLRGRELGFSLGEIRELLRLGDAQDGGCAEAEAIARRHIGDIGARIADLKRIGRLLETLAAECRKGRRPACPILDALARGRTKP